jgi:hypothetical protein
MNYRSQKFVTSLCFTDAAALLILVAIALCAPRATAEPLDPLAFPSLGPLTLPAGSYTLDTGVSIIDTPTLTVGVTTYHGTVAGQSTTFNPQVAVFDFDQLHFDPGAVLRVTGNRPLALLSRGNLSIEGGQIVLAAGGAGGGFGSTPTVAGNGPGTGGSSAGSGGGGGGFGGAGGGGVLGAGFIDSASRGVPYGNLITALQAGSGGGASADRGGNGGGALELGAFGQLDVHSCFLLAGGQDAANRPTGSAGGAGGGSGGGILLHASVLSLDQSLFFVQGGKGGNDYGPYHGGGGAGGRIVFAPDTYSPGDNLGSGLQLALAGGAGGSGGPEPGFPAESGSPGTLTIAPTTTLVRDGQTLTVTNGKLPTGEDFMLRGLFIQDGASALFLGRQTTAAGAVTLEGQAVLTISNQFTTANPVTLPRGSAIAVGGVVTASGPWSIDRANVSAPRGITLTDTGALTGRGIVAGPVTAARGANPAAVAITAANGTLALGDPNNANGIDIDRPIVLAPVGGASTSPGRLLLLDADHALIGDATLGAGTTLQAPNGITLRPARQITAGPDAVISGNFTNQGAVAGPTVSGKFLTFTDDVDGPGSFTGNIRHQGIYSPTPSPAPVPAGNDLQFAASAGLAVDVAPDTTNLRLKAGGAVLLNGTLKILTAAGFSPPPLQAYPLLQAKSRTGVFTAYTGTDAGKGLLYAPVYTDSGLTLIPTLPGDANVDGHVDFTDLVALAQHYNTSAGALWPDGDFTYDGVVGFNDLVLLAQHYNASVFAPAPVSPDAFNNDWQVALASVPEPAALSLVALVPLLLAHRRRK